MVLPPTALLGREECGWLKTTQLAQLLPCLGSSCCTVERPKADCTSCPQWSNTYLCKTGKGQRKAWPQGEAIGIRWECDSTLGEKYLWDITSDLHRGKSWATEVFGYGHLPKSWWATKFLEGVCSFVIPLYFCISLQSLSLGLPVGFPSASWGCFVKGIGIKYFSYPCIADVTMARFIPAF